MGPYALIDGQARLSAYLYAHYPFLYSHFTFYGYLPAHPAPKECEEFGK